MLAEKIQTIYARGFLNSRSKDYYDLYIIYKLKDKDVNAEILREACRKTFQYRKTEFDIGKIIDLLENLKTNEAFLKRWQAYSRKNLYAKATPATIRPSSPSSSRPSRTSARSA